MSFYGVMRGLHFQRPPFTQSKLVRCVKGRVLDVAVDIRKGSPTYGKHVAVELTEDNHRQFFIPKGFAHGFAVLSETAVFQYKCDNFYHPEADGGISIPQGRRGKPPYSVLGTATLLGWRTIKGLRQVVRDGTAWGRLAHQCCCSSLGWLIFIKGRKVVGICGITDYADFDLCGLG